MMFVSGFGCDQKLVRWSKLITTFPTAL